MTTIRLAVAGLVALGLGSTATAQQMIASDRVEAHMIAADNSELPIHEERLTVDIDGEYARSTLLQTYFNSSGGRIEGTYQLQPGQNSHVDGFAYWNGEQKIVGEVFERETAHRVYDQVVARKRDPGLLEADGEGRFAFKVFPIEPRENKRVEVRWNKWLERHAQSVHYRAPISSRSAEIVVTIEGPIKNVASTTHKLSIEKLAGGIRLRATGAESAGALDLTWDIDEPAWTPDAYVQAVKAPDEGWFALALAAPKLPTAVATAKDLTIVIDRSGSMQTDQKMLYAKRAAAAMVGLLDPGDRVNVISFSDEVDPLFHTPHVVDAQTRELATAFIDRLHPGGGTDIALALQTAVMTQDRASKSDRPRVVVFLTDGQSDAEKAVSVPTGDLRLFTLGLGRDVNRPLLARLAAEKRGRFVYIEDAREIEPEVGRLSQAIAKPLLVDVSVTVEGIEATRIYPRTLPDVFAEDELRVSGRFRGTGPAKFTIRGKLGGKPVEYVKTIDLAHVTPRPWTAPLWAQARVDHLLEELALDGSKEELKAEVLDLALAYNFVTPYTAFLAIPESELGAASSTLADARARKRQIIAQQPELDAFGGEVVTTAGASPTIDATTNAKRVASRDDDDDGATDAKGEAIMVQGHHGCAGCATGSGDGATALVLVGIVALVIRRRRRR
jgi:Ca-activated chloride channel homolog